MEREKYLVKAKALAQLIKDAKERMSRDDASEPHIGSQQNTDTDEAALEKALSEKGNKKVVIPTVFTTAPKVMEAFNKTEYAKRLEATGVIISYICPLMYMNNPLCKKMPVITSSNKLRTYTTARYYTDEEILDKITGGKK